MKLKLIFASILMLATMALSAQSNLYKGIKSGMTQSEFTTYINSHPDFEWVSSAEMYKLTIKGRPFAMSAEFNDKGKLNALFFYGLSRYEWYDYDANVKPQAVELFTLLQVSYGNPILDEWPSWPNIPDGGSLIACAFTKGSVYASILVAESSDVYFLGLIIIDKMFSDPEIQTSEGF